MNMRHKYFLLSACSMLTISLLFSSCKKNENIADIEVATPRPAAEQTQTPVQTLEQPQTQEITTEEPSPTVSVTPAPIPPKAKAGKQGYIYIPNTKVDYVVVLGEDNEYYLDRDENGKRDYHGAIFMDYRNALGDERRNIVLYGHNMKDSTMFTTLHRFEKKDFFEENKDIVFEMFGVRYSYEIVYSGMMDYREYNHIRTKFASETEFLEYFNKGEEHAQFVRDGYEPQPGDQMLTLSTCVSHSIKDYDKKRLVVVARMTGVVGEGEKSNAPDEYDHNKAFDVFVNAYDYANAMMQFEDVDSSVSSGVEQAPPGD